MNKIVRPGNTRIGARSVPVFCKIELKDGKLSIVGVEGPEANGNCAGSCGQIVMSRPVIIELAQGWTPELIERFFNVWERWHLNDMRAGSEVQEDWLRKNQIPPEEYAYPKSHYEVASSKLAIAGLNPDQSGYRYGHSWNFEKLPDDVVSFLESLPDADESPAWV